MFFPCSDNTFWFKLFFFEYHLSCVIFALFSITAIIYNFISMVQKNEEAKRQIKLKKSTNKFDIRNFAELKDRYVKNFNLAAKIL